MSKGRIFMLRPASLHMPTSSAPCISAPGSAGAGRLLAQAAAVLYRELRHEGCSSPPHFLHSRHKAAGRTFKLKTGAGLHARPRLSVPEKVSFPDGATPPTALAGW